jgi:hypothetical protein
MRWLNAQLHDDALSVPANGALIVIGGIHKAVSFGEPKRQVGVVGTGRFL